MRDVIAPLLPPLAGTDMTADEHELVRDMMALLVPRVGMIAAMDMGRGAIASLRRARA